MAVTLSLAIFATTSTWAQSAFGGGTGTNTDPYIISTADHLRQLSEDVMNGNSYYEKYFRQTEDIDFEGATFLPIGGNYVREKGGATSFLAFSGYYNGHDHSISNVHIVEHENVNATGLFGYTRLATILSVKLMGTSTVTGTANVGAIAGDASASSEIFGCEVGPDVTVLMNGSGTTGVNIGGLVGFVGENTLIKGCTSSATINGADKTSQIGGLAGRNQGTIRDSYVWGVVGGGKSCIGDFVGDNKGTLIDNFYHSSNPYGAVNGTSASGVKWLGTISLGPDVDGTISSNKEIWHDNTLYYTQDENISLTLSYTGTPDEGYTHNFTASAGTLVPTGNGYQLTMPASKDVIISADATQLRDIGYKAWVDISCPRQQYTGSALTPVVTVTDSKSGTPVTLSEGTDYQLIMPDGDVIQPGKYTIVVVGMGNYGGEAAVVFNVYHPTFSEGSGTEDDPYLIRNIAGMEAIASTVNGGNNLSGVYFRLAANLDYKGKTYTPIGVAFDKPFSGHFYGEVYYSISNVTLSGSGNLGLFSYIRGATIKRVVLEKSSITGTGNNIGGIVGFNHDATVEQCTVKEDVTVSGKESVGGIVGHMSYGTVSSCTNHGSVNGEKYIGGIVGEEESNAYISGCQNFGQITATVRYVGGIVGCSLSVSTIEWGFNEGSVSAPDYAGGIVGMAISSTISSCFNMAAVNSSGDDVGGITGYHPTGDNRNTLTNNHYAGACTVGGVAKIDRSGACKGWKILYNEDELFVQQASPDAGYTHDGILYLGAGESAPLSISRGMEFSGYTLNVSAGTLTPIHNEEDRYTLSMPNTGQDVTISLAGDLILDLPDNDTEDWYDNDRRVENNAGYTGKVRLLGRTLYKDGAWNTLCLPFDVVLAGSPLEGAIAKTLANATMAGTRVTLYFGEPVTTLQAGVPYIIKWTSGTDIVSPVFTDVTVKNETHPVKKADGNVQFVGYYKCFDITPANNNIYYLTAGNKLKRTGINRMLRACRAYFRFTEAAQACQQVLDFGEDVTGIVSMEDVRSQMSDAWYTLDGRKLQGEPTTKGVYVKNGKIVVIK